jgi:hypothetical protein
MILGAATALPSQAAAQRSQAAAQYPKVTMEGFKLQRKDFRFGSYTGWLKREGEWHVEGPIRHRGRLCGTYELGMRFGVGSPDCTDVKWVSEPRFVTSQSQCNDAEMLHSGTEIDAALAKRFDAITCAERVVRCSGNCKQPGAGKRLPGMPGLKVLFGLSRQHERLSSMMGQPANPAG